MRGLLTFYLEQNPPANQQGAACRSNTLWALFRKHSWVLPTAGMLCMIFCIYLDNAKLNLKTCGIANMGTLQQNDCSQSGCFIFFLLFLVRRGWCFLFCGLISVPLYAIQWWSTSNKEDNGIHITSADVDYNNIIITITFIVDNMRKKSALSEHINRSKNKLCAHHDTLHLDDVGTIKISGKLSFHVLSLKPHT